MLLMMGTLWMIEFQYFHNFKQNILKLFQTLFIGYEIFLFKKKTAKKLISVKRKIYVIALKTIVL
jgi:hypothetical protein